MGIVMPCGLLARLYVKLAKQSTVQTAGLIVSANDTLKIPT
jgi:hypothetical protein